MKQAWKVGVLLLAMIGAALAAQKCPAIQASMVDKGFGGGPWRVMSGGPGECSFMAADTSVNFGFSHMVSESTELAQKAAVEMREAIAGNSLVEPMATLGEEGFACAEDHPPSEDNQTDVQEGYKPHQLAADESPSGEYQTGDEACYHQYQHRPLA